MTKLTRKQFAQFQTEIADIMDHTHRVELWGTKRIIFEDLMDYAGNEYFAAEMAEDNERKQLEDLLMKYGVPDKFKGPIIADGHDTTEFICTAQNKFLSIARIKTYRKILDDLENGRKIDAIKAIRNEHKIGLKEAMDIVNNVMYFLTENTIIDFGAPVAYTYFNDPAQKPLIEIEHNINKVATDYFGL